MVAATRGTWNAKGGARALALPIAALALVIGSPAAPVQAAGASEPRALSEPERAAVELAIDVASRGPVAVWDKLAPGAPLRALERAEALAEIDARLGPLEGATWTLDSLAPGTPAERAVMLVHFASGVDDFLVLDWRSEEGRWLLDELHTGAEPLGSSALPASLRATASVPSRTEPLARGLTMLAALGALALLPSSARARRMACAGGALALAMCGAPPPEQDATAESPRAPLRLGTLAPLRRAVASGADPAVLERELAARPAHPELAAVHDLWQAQVRLADGELARATSLLAAEPTPSPRPLAELLRARLALARLDLGGADALFDRVASAGIDSDSIRLEALEARLLEGEVGFHDAWLVLLAERQTRLARPWYLNAAAAVLANDFARAELAFQMAWRLEPLARSELLEDPVLASLATRRAVFELVDFAEESGSISTAPPGSRPIVLPDSAEAQLSGSSLRLAHRQFELLVPNGGSIAPAGTPTESAEARVDRARRRVLAELPRLERIAAARVGSPGARDLALATAATEALIEQRRFADVLRLTDGQFGRVELASGSLARSRALALVRRGRPAEARDLLLELAGVERGNERPRVATLYDLGYVMGELGEFDQAIRLLRAADAQLPVPFAEGEIRRLALSQSLRATSERRTSAHFDVGVPRGSTPGMAEQMVELLERERGRLLEWIPRGGSKRIEVELVPLDQFAEAYGGLGISGLYDGRVRVPFLDQESLAPELVAIYAHEVAHALLDTATKGQAPRWFGEGLAQHVETWTRNTNPMPDLDRTGRRISFAALEPILDGFADDQFIELAYSEAAWAVAFVEAKFGRGALHRLQDRFAAGSGTEAAIAEVLGMTLSELDRSFWSWGIHEAPRFRAVEGPRFDLERAPVLSTH